MKRLEGKYILITGASQGLGRQLAIDYAREGAKGISITARRSGALEEVRDRIGETSPYTQVVLIVADLSRQDDIERVVATTLAEFSGRLDVLVNNASSIGPTPMPYLLDYPLEDFRSVLEVNLIAPYLLIKKSLPAMIERGGSIIDALDLETDIRGLVRDGRGIGPGLEMFFQPGNGDFHWPSPSWSAGISSTAKP